MARTHGDIVYDTAVTPFTNMVFSFNPSMDK